MRKKFMLVAALAGILSLGACVDDKESASVEAVRNAKAEQLKALAALDNAKAEAELIYANAEKALKEAQAEYERAQAEGEAQRTEEARQKFELEIQRLQAQLEADLLNLEREKKANEIALLTQADQEVQRLYGNYSNEADKLAGLNRDVVNKTADLVGLEAGVVSAEAYVNQQTLFFNKTIATNTAKKGVLEGLADNDKEALTKKASELNIQIKEAQDTYAVLNDEANTAVNAAQKAHQSLDDTKLKEIVDELRNDYYFFLIKSESKYNSIIFATLFNYSLIDSEVVNVRLGLTSDIYDQKTMIGAPKAGTVVATGLYVYLETLQTQFNNAKKAYEDAVRDKDPESVIEMKRRDMETARKELLAWEENIARAKGDLADYEQKLVNFEALVAAFPTENTAYGKDLEGVLALIDVAEAAGEKRNDASDKLSDLNSLYYSISSLANGLTDIPQEIAYCETAIANAKENIANLTDVQNAESALAYAKEEIETIKAKIAAQKIIVANAKAALDAALA